ncbi:hypothetical protein INR49_025038, partial [Caranx melampygus]
MTLINGCENYSGDEEDGGSVKCILVKDFNCTVNFYKIDYSWILSTWSPSAATHRQAAEDTLNETLWPELFSGSSARTVCKGRLGAVRSNGKEVIILYSKSLLGGDKSDPVTVLHQTEVLEVSGEAPLTVRRGCQSAPFNNFTCFGQLE